MSRLPRSKLFKDLVTFRALLTPLAFLSRHFKETKHEVFQLSHRSIKSSCLHLFEFYLLWILNLFISIHKNKSQNVKKKLSAQIEHKLQQTLIRTEEFAKMTLQKEH